jgi:hypothetical protein
MAQPSTGTSARQVLLDRLAARDLDSGRSTDLDVIDEAARENGSWGSVPHREARDRREREYDAARAQLATLPDDVIESALATRETPRD